MLYIFVKPMVMDNDYYPYSVRILITILDRTLNWLKYLVICIL